jgi:hypothetical protein
VRRTAGSVGRAPGWLRLTASLAEPQMLEKREGDHAQQSVMVQPMPGAPLEVVQADASVDPVVALRRG